MRSLRSCWNEKGLVEWKLLYIQVWNLSGEQTVPLSCFFPRFFRIYHLCLMQRS